MQYRPRTFNFLPPVIKNLLIINGLMFLATLSFGSTFGYDVNRNWGLYLPFLSEQFHPAQIVTHMFLHGNFTHLFFNMFALWMFGAPLENLWGSKRFLIFYMITGLGAAFLHMGVMYWEYYSVLNDVSPEILEQIKREGYGVLMQNQNYRNESMADLNRLLNIPTVGASGAVFGILAGFGMMFPNQYIYLYFLFPVKTKYFVIVYGALELLNGLTLPGSGIAHFAHVGGMLFGYLLIRHWRKNRYRQY